MLPPTPPPAGLVDNAGLIKAIFDADSAPSLRTLDRMRLRGEIPHIKLGRLVFYSVPGVLEALQKRSIQRCRRIT